LVSFFQFSWNEKEGFNENAEKDYMLGTYMKDIMVPNAFHVFKNAKEACIQEDKARNSSDLIPFKFRKPNSTTNLTTMNSYNFQADQITLVPSAKTNKTESNHNSASNEQLEMSSTEKINNLFVQLINELKKTRECESNEDKEIKVPMPSSGWCNSSDSDEGEEAKSLAWKENNVLETLLKSANDDEEIPITFKNCTGLNHRSRSEEVICKNYEPITFKKVVRRCKSHHVYPTYNMPLLKKVSPVSSNSSIESEDVENFVDSLVKGNTNVSIAELTKLAKKDSDSSLKPKSSQCSISTISEPASTSTPKTMSTVDLSIVKDIKANDNCLKSSTGELKDTNAHNKVLSRKRRTPCESGSTQSSEQVKKRKISSIDNTKLKLKIHYTDNDSINKTSKKRKITDTSSNTDAKRQKLSVANDVKEPSKIKRRRPGFFREIFLIYKYAATTAFNWTFKRKRKTNRR